ncbi:MAG TPA: hypothetical protein VGP82_09925 [Ktedonobacterales bacterium]|nr:hypothetical protein [Ktedonobacterales bacterium]
MANNRVITTFFFVGGLVPLEKGEGGLAGIVVTPLRVRRRVFPGQDLSLSLLGIIERLALIVFTEGLHSSRCRSWRAWPCCARYLCSQASLRWLASIRSTNTCCLPSLL